MVKSLMVSRRKSLAVATILAVVAAFGITSVGASTASADTLGSISGTVTSASTGTPIDNVQVGLDLPGGNYVQFGSTDSDGNYSFTGLAATTYVINFSPNFGDNYASQWWNNKPTLSTATPISLAAGQTLTGVDASLADGATVTGHVDGVSTQGEPFGVLVYDNAGNELTSAYTDSAGNYTASALPAGSLTVEFTSSVLSPYETVWWNDESSQATANFFTTTAGGTTTGIDASFASVPSGSVSGTVYGPDSSGAGISNLPVEALNTDGSLAASGSTGSDGGYTLTGLAPGSYTLEFLNGFAAPTLASQYWQDEPTLSSADFFTVAAGDALTGYDAHLAVGGSITGTVLDGSAGNSPAAGAGINVYENGSLVNGFVQTDSNGSYTFTGLAPGNYEVQFQAGYPSTDAIQWWKDATSESSATPIAITDGTTVSGINATLHAGGTISGVVSGRTANGTVLPAGNAQLAVYAADGSLVTDSVYGGDDGSYSVTNLAAGSYKIYFQPQPDTTDFVPQWWKNKSTEATATAITIKGDQTKVVSPVLASTALKPATPHISGSARVGATLTAKPGTWKPGTVSLTYQWSRAGVAVSGATSSTYALTNADANSTITVTVTGSEAGYTTDSVTSAPTKAVGDGVLSTGTPTIAGTTAVGHALTAGPGTWGPGTVDLTYKWFRGAARIGGATSSTYTLVHADAGKTITVRVTGAEPGFTTATIASAPTDVVH